MLCSEASLMLATELHKGQFRNDGVTPYINHPIDVANLLTQCEFQDKDLIISVGYLHDVLENCNISSNQLMNMLIDKTNDIDNSYNIVCTVQELTFVDNNVKYAKDLYISNIACNGSNNARIVKIADRICNTWDFVYSGNSYYAKKYFHKCDALFYWAYNNNIKGLFRQIDTLNNYFCKDGVIND